MLWGKSTQALSAMIENGPDAMDDRGVVTLDVCQKASLSRHAIVALTDELIRRTGWQEPSNRTSSGPCPLRMKGGTWRRGIGPAVRSPKPIES